MRWAVSTAPPVGSPAPRPRASAPSAAALRAAAGGSAQHPLPVSWQRRGRSTRQRELRGLPASYGDRGCALSPPRPMGIRAAETILKYALEKAVAADVCAATGSCC